MTKAAFACSRHRFVGGICQGCGLHEHPCWRTGHHIVKGRCEKCGRETDPLALARELFPQITPTQLLELAAIFEQLAEVQKVLAELEALRPSGGLIPLSPYRPIPIYPNPYRPYPNPYGTGTGTARGSANGPTPINGGCCV